VSADVKNSREIKPFCFNQHGPLPDLAIAALMEKFLVTIVPVVKNK
jgi:hypothetical protein